MDLSITTEYERFERHHWWHVARREIILQCLRRFLHGGGIRWLDVGCATGILLESCPDIIQKVGVESHEPFVRRGHERGLDIRHTTRHWDFAALGGFDLVTLCDVLEHVEQEQEALRAVQAVLNPQGLVLLTVPALKSLWSAHDEAAYHFRRYDRRSLTRLFDTGGWKILYVSYFSSFLLPVIWMVRKLTNLRQAILRNPARHNLSFGPPAMDRVLLAIFRLERRVLRWIPMPLGSSLILVAQKRE